MNEVPWFKSRASPRAFPLIISMSTISSVVPPVIKAKAVVAPTSPAPIIAILDIYFPLKSKIMKLLLH